MAFIPLILLLAVGTKLEHVITQLAHEVAEKHTTIEGGLVVKPSDEHFWFSRPKIVLHLIHFILFQNAFEIAYFFWILETYGFHSCIMGRARFIFPRLVIGVIIQLLSSYSTLPLYAIVTQMGSSIKMAIFNKNVQDCLLEWTQKAKKSRTPGSSLRFGSIHLGSSTFSPADVPDSSTHMGRSSGSSNGSPLAIQLKDAGEGQSTVEQGTLRPSAAFNP
ncbi:MLO-like protein 1 [Asimina triloba]